ncbi:type II toxin-antitoxin system HicA family toxin [Sporichthya sp.]|uniref:type II toxin-antitoxin system HicA family toxin n=1 Tax=Sporichthya sp. TaxID=65475 RepID=UPI00180D897C|nr:type II toxin-antitoxin system HicA family toxin [Sporichthya sp.]MBA3745713.1 type II toxin-antitoxin system HicA family toxin [Sporichthya sp.]
MSPKLPLLSGAAIVAILERAGFTHVSTRGSHAKLRDAGGRTAIVPLHREVARGTLASILRQAGLTMDEFLGLLG